MSINSSPVKPTLKLGSEIFANSLRALLCSGSIEKQPIFKIEQDTVLPVFYVEDLFLSGCPGRHPP